ncbi:MAG: dethiobiotin synthase [Bacteroidia bacterium]|nr:dethiobiotin synthase [Bacteroidia bacterium]
MHKRYFVTGIGTGVGKTFTSAVLCRKFKASYWKPVQTGSSEGTDSSFIKTILSDLPECRVLKETYVYPQPLSPHYAAALNGEEIRMEKILLPPDLPDLLIVEGAGGLLVPLNDKYFVIDLASKFEAQIILVISNYLGCINHSLLSFEYLKNKNYPVKGIVLNGNFEPEVKDIILKHSSFPLLAEIPELASNNIEAIKQAIEKDIVRFYQSL